MGHTASKYFFFTLNSQISITHKSFWRHSHDVTQHVRCILKDFSSIFFLQIVFSLSCNHIPFLIKHKLQHFIFLCPFFEYITYRKIQYTQVLPLQKGTQNYSIIPKHNRGWGWLGLIYSYIWFFFFLFFLNFFRYKLLTSSDCGLYSARTDLGRKRLDWRLLFGLMIFFVHIKYSRAPQT